MMNKHSNVLRRLPRLSRLVIGLIVCLQCVLQAVPASALTRTAPAKDEISDLRKLTEEFMTKVGDEDISGAFDIVRPKFRISKREIDAVVTQTISQRDALLNRYGNYVNYELISQETVGRSLVQFVYLEKRENFGLLWFFVYYKAKSQWSLVTLNWNDRIIDLFAAPTKVQPQIAK